MEMRIEALIPIITKQHRKLMNNRSMVSGIISRGRSDTVKENFNQYKT